MCHFLAPAGQPEMMHKNFMHRHLRIFVVRCSCMKFYAILEVERVRKLKKYKPTEFMAKTSHYDKEAADYACFRFH